MYRLGFPSLCLQDSPLGVRYADLVSAFPSGITTGATWVSSLPTYVPSSCGDGG